MPFAARLITASLSDGATNNLVRQLHDYLASKKHWPLAVATSSIPTSLLDDLPQYPGPLSDIVANCASLTLSPSLLVADPAVATPLELTDLSRYAILGQPMGPGSTFELEPTVEHPHHGDIPNFTHSFDYLVELGLKVAPATTRARNVPPTRDLPVPLRPRIAHLDNSKGLITLGRHGPNAAAPDISRRRTHLKTVALPGSSHSSLPSVLPSASAMRHQSQYRQSTSLDPDVAAAESDYPPTPNAPIMEGDDDDDELEIVEVPVQTTPSHRHETHSQPYASNSGISPVATYRNGNVPLQGKTQKTPSIQSFREKLLHANEIRSRQASLIDEGKPLPSQPPPDTVFARNQRRKEKADIRNRNKTEREQRERERKRKRVGRGSRGRERERGQERSRGLLHDDDVALDGDVGSSAGTPEKTKEENVILLHDSDSPDDEDDQNKRQRVQSPRREHNESVSVSNGHMSGSSSQRNGHGGVTRQGESTSITSQEYFEKRKAMFNHFEKEGHGTNRLSLDNTTLLEDFLKGSNSMFSGTNLIDVLFQEDDDGQQHYVTLRRQPRGYWSFSNYPL